MAGVVRTVEAAKLLLVTGTFGAMFDQTVFGGVQTTKVGFPIRTVQAAS